MTVQFGRTESCTYTSFVTCARNIMYTTHAVTSFSVLFHAHDAQTHMHNGFAIVCGALAEYRRLERSRALAWRVVSLSCHHLLLFYMDLLHHPHDPPRRRSSVQVTHAKSDYFVSGSTPTHRCLQQQSQLQQCRRSTLGHSSIHYSHVAHFISFLQACHALQRSLVDAGRNAMSCDTMLSAWMRQPMRWSAFHAHDCALWRQSLNALQSCSTVNAQPQSSEAVKTAATTVSNNTCFHDSNSNIYTACYSNGDAKGHTRHEKGHRHCSDEQRQGRAAHAQNVSVGNQDKRRSGPRAQPNPHLCRSSRYACCQDCKTDVDPVHDTQYYCSHRHSSDSCSSSSSSNNHRIVHPSFDDLDEKHEQVQQQKSQQTSLLLSSSASSSHVVHPALLDSALQDGITASLQTCRLCDFHARMQSVWQTLRELQQLHRVALAHLAVAPLALPHDMLPVSTSEGVLRLYHAARRLAVLGMQMARRGTDSEQLATAQHTSNRDEARINAEHSRNCCRSESSIHNSSEFAATTQQMNVSELCVTLALQLLSGVDVLRPMHGQGCPCVTPSACSGLPGSSIDRAPASAEKARKLSWRAGEEYGDVGEVVRARLLRVCLLTLTQGLDGVTEAGQRLADTARALTRWYRSGRHESAQEDDSAGKQVQHADRSKAAEESRETSHNATADGESESKGCARNGYKRTAAVSAEDTTRSSQDSCFDAAVRCVFASAQHWSCSRAQSPYGAKHPEPSRHDDDDEDENSDDDLLDDTTVQRRCIRRELVELQQVLLLLTVFVVVVHHAACTGAPSRYLLDASLWVMSAWVQPTLDKCVNSDRAASAARHRPLVALCWLLCAELTRWGGVSRHDTLFVPTATPASCSSSSIQETEIDAASQMTHTKEAADSRVGAKSTIGANTSTAHDRSSIDGRNVYRISSEAMQQIARAGASATRFSDCARELVGLTLHPAGVSGVVGLCHTAESLSSSSAAVPTSSTPSTNAQTSAATTFAQGSVGGGLALLPWWCVQLWVWLCPTLFGSGSAAALELQHWTLAEDEDDDARERKLEDDQVGCEKAKRVSLAESATNSSHAHAQRASTPAWCVCTTDTKEGAAHGHGSVERAGDDGEGCTKRELRGETTCRSSSDGSRTLHDENASDTGNSTDATPKGMSHKDVSKSSADTRRSRSVRLAVAARNAAMLSRRAIQARGGGGVVAFMRGTAPAPLTQPAKPREQTEQRHPEQQSRPSIQRSPRKRVQPKRSVAAESVVDPMSSYTSSPTLRRAREFARKRVPALHRAALTDAAAVQSKSAASSLHLSNTKANDTQANNDNTSKSTKDRYDNNRAHTVCQALRWRRSGLAFWWRWYSLFVASEETDEYTSATATTSTTTATATQLWAFRYCSTADGDMTMAAKEEEEANEPQSHTEQPFALAKQTMARAVVAPKSCCCLKDGHNHTRITYTPVHSCHLRVDPEGNVMCLLIAQMQSGSECAGVANVKEATVKTAGTSRVGDSTANKDHATCERDGSRNSRHGRSGLSTTSSQLDSIRYVCDPVRRGGHHGMAARTLLRRSSVLSASCDVNAQLRQIHFPLYPSTHAAWEEAFWSVRGRTQVTPRRSHAGSTAFSMSRAATHGARRSRDGSFSDTPTFAGCVQTPRAKGKKQQQQQERSVTRPKLFPSLSVMSCVSEMQSYVARYSDTHLVQVVAGASVGSDDEAGNRSR